MKVLKRGKGAPKWRLIRCKCKCIFIAKAPDSYLDRSVLGSTYRYVDCPECGGSNYYSDALALTRPKEVV